MSDNAEARGLVDINEHDVVENSRGELMLVFDGQEEQPGGQPYLQLSAKRAEAILHRGTGHPMRLHHVDPEAMERLRAVDAILVAELKPNPKGGAEDVLHNYVAAIQQD